MVPFVFFLHKKLYVLVLISKHPISHFVFAHPISLSVIVFSIASSVFEDSSFEIRYLPGGLAPH